MEDMKFRYEISIPELEGLNQITADFENVRKDHKQLKIIIDGKGYLYDAVMGAFVGLVEREELDKAIEKEANYLRIIRNDEARLRELNEIVDNERALTKSYKSQRDSMQKHLLELFGKKPQLEEFQRLRDRVQFLENMLNDKQVPEMLATIKNLEAKLDSNQAQHLKELDEINVKLMDAVGQIGEYEATVRRLSENSIPKDKVCNYCPGCEDLKKQIADLKTINSRYVNERLVRQSQRPHIIGKDCHSCDDTHLLKQTVKDYQARVSQLKESRDKWKRQYKAIAKNYDKLDRDFAAKREVYEQLQKDFMALKKEHDDYLVGYKILEKADKEKDEVNEEYRKKVHDARRKTWDACLERDRCLKDLEDLKGEYDLLKANTPSIIPPVRVGDCEACSKYREQVTTLAAKVHSLEDINKRQRQMLHDAQRQLNRSIEASPILLQFDTGENIPIMQATMVKCVEDQPCPNCFKLRDKEAIIRDRDQSIVILRSALQKEKDEHCKDLLDKNAKIGGQLQTIQHREKELNEARARITNLEQTLETLKEINRRVNESLSKATYFTCGPNMEAVPMTARQLYEDKKQLEKQIAALNSKLFDIEASTFGGPRPDCKGCDRLTHYQNKAAAFQRVFREHGFTQVAGYTLNDDPCKDCKDGTCKGCNWRLKE